LRNLKEYKREKIAKELERSDLKTPRFEEYVKSSGK